jgi:glycosyltransferase involved in cell wall biosynthesis
MSLFVNARFLTQPISGVQRYGIECSRQIKIICPEAVFVCPKNLWHKEIADELEVKIIGKNTGHVWEQFDLPRYLAGQKSPLLNLCNTAPLIYRNNFITIHDLAFHHHPEWNSKFFSAWYNFLVPRIARRSRQVFTVSETIKNELIAAYHLPASKISVTYNGISENLKSIGASGRPEKEKIILSVGTFSTRKNHQKLIEAFLNSDIKNEYQLVIVGDKNKVFRESKVDEAMLKAGNVKIYNRFTEQELVTMYQKAEIVVSLSLYEGFGIPLLEGLYSGCKIICSDIPVYREVYNGHATFCDPTDTRSIINAMTQSVKNRPPHSIESLFEKYSYRRSAEVIVEQMTTKK